MKRSRPIGLLAACGLAIVLFLTLAASASAATATGGKNVFVLTNKTTNRVIVYARTDNGTLRKVGTYVTGGKGTGAALGSLGSLVLSRNGRWLFAANPGSDSITVYAVNGHRLRRTDVEPCGGSHPVSLTYHDRVLYVLNTGAAGNICGFRRATNGKLTPLSDSTMPLSNEGVGPSPQGVQISFCPTGKVLATSEVDTGKLMVYPLDEDTAKPLYSRVFDSVGQTPCGFAMNNLGTVVVAESAGNTAGAASATSYLLHCGDNMELKTPSVGDNGTSATGVAVSLDGRWAYVSNRGSGSISRYQVYSTGKLVLRTGKAGVTGRGSEPDGMVLTGGGGYLYTLCPGAGTVRGFHVRSTGRLARFAKVTIPKTSSGIAAW